MISFLKGLRARKKEQDAKHPTSLTFTLADHAIDHPRPMKVVVVGAGFSGLVAGIRLSQRVKNLDLIIYEAQAGIGGVWYANKYPGVACDIPSHCYQLSFEPNRNWSAFYAPGAEIQEYLHGVAEKYNLLPYIKLEHRLVHAQFCEETGKWNLRIQRPIQATSSVVQGDESNEAAAPVEIIEDTADVLLTAFGALSQWKWPDIEGLRDFKGKLIHSARWDEEPALGTNGSDKSWKDQKVAVIGVGSSALQIVPSLQPKVGTLYNYVRGKTWIGVPFVANKLAEFSKSAPERNYKFTEEDKANFQDDGYYRKFRLELENELNSSHPYTILNSMESLQGREIFKTMMEKKLEKKPWIAEHLIPNFPVACRRLTPAPGYLEALCENNVCFIPNEISKVTPTGIQTVDGKHQELDTIICATGFDTTYNVPFPFIGRGNLTLTEAYTPHPKTYLSLAVHRFPNWFQFVGPNSAIGTGSLVSMIEKQVDYAVEAVCKMQREWIKTMEPTQQAVDDFDDYIEAYFPKTVFSQKCRSWYKMGKDEGRIVALWPGSSLHASRTFSHPRWEDYSYTYLSATESNQDSKGLCDQTRTRQNRFSYLGNGESYAERMGTGELAWYLQEVDVPPRLPDPPKV